MKRAREKSKKRCLIAFSDGKAWLEYELSFNVGSKHKRPVKFEANQTWRSNQAPSLFAALRADFPSIQAAEDYFSEALAKEGGTVHARTPEMVERLRTEYGYDRPRR
jgi:hypothetical protein